MMRRDHHREMAAIRRSMRAACAEASRLFDGLNGIDRAGALERIRQVGGIKYQIKKKAREMGHWQRCRNTIPECGGACCKWHFPKSLHPVDFFIAISGLSAEERLQLEALLEETGKGPYQCPLLLYNGCCLSFENRPLVCTNAYPCTMDRSYWEYLQSIKAQIGALIRPLEELFPNPRTRFYES